MTLMSLSPSTALPVELQAATSDSLLVRGPVWHAVVLPSALSLRPGQRVSVQAAACLPLPSVLGAGTGTGDAGADTGAGAGAGAGAGGSAEAGAVPVLGTRLIDKALAAFRGVVHVPVLAALVCEPRDGPGGTAAVDPVPSFELCT